MSLVTLTFDNGPTLATTPLVLDELQARKLSAHFCVVGTQLQTGREQVDIARETLARGHRIVNHSLTHGTALGDDPSLLHATREVTDMHALMAAKLGAWGEPWFRPFGRGGVLGRHVLSEPAVEQLRSLGYSVLLWNCVPRDWEDRRGWVDTALKQIDSQDHTVVVLHDLDTGAMDHLPRFLDALAARGDTVTTAVPDDCVPMRGGRRTWPAPAFDALCATAWCGSSPRRT